MDHCYDCRAEVDVLRDYLAKWHGVTEENDMINKIEELSMW